MAVILQTPFSDYFLTAFLFIFHCILLLWVQLTITQHWSNLVKVSKARQRTGGKPLPEPILTWLTIAIMCNRASMSWIWHIGTEARFGPMPTMHRFDFRSVLAISVFSMDFRHLNLIQNAVSQPNLSIKYRAFLGNVTELPELKKNSLITAILTNSFTQILHFLIIEFIHVWTFTFDILWDISMISHPDEWKSVTFSYTLPLSVSRRSSSSVVRFSLFKWLSGVSFVYLDVCTCILPKYGFSMICQNMSCRYNLPTQSVELTHWGLMTPYGDSNLGQHWLM